MTKEPTLAELAASGTPLPLTPPFGLERIPLSLDILDSLVERYLPGFAPNWVDFDREGQHIVTPVEWEIIKYRYDQEANGLERTVVGTIKQYPITLAWALTIHKSQGQGFAEAMIDVGRGLFDEGMLYVALSRVESAAGLYLKVPLQTHDLMTSRTVRKFLQEQAP